MIREIDTKEHELQTTQQLSPEYWQWVDMNTRNSFHCRTRAGTIKCSVEYNHYGCREVVINKDIYRDVAREKTRNISSYVAK